MMVGFFLTSKTPVTSCGGRRREVGNAGGPLAWSMVLLGTLASSEASSGGGAFCWLIRGKKEAGRFLRSALVGCSNDVVYYSASCVLFLA